MKKNIVRVGRYKLRTIHVHAYTWFDKTYYSTKSKVSYKELKAIR